MLTVKAKYDNKELRNELCPCGSGKNIKNAEGGKMALDIFLGIIIVTVPAFAFVAFVAHVVSKL
jgi:hypothetical protein